MTKSYLDSLFKKHKIKFKSTENVYTIFPKDSKQRMVVDTILTRIDLELLETTRHYRFFIEPIEE
jgi:predicted nucleic acid-binding OB-fold protein